MNNISPTYMTYKSYKQRLNIKLGLDEDTEHTLKQLKDIT